MIISFHKYKKKWLNNLSKEILQVDSTKKSSLLAKGEALWSKCSASEEAQATNYSIVKTDLVNHIELLKKLADQAKGWKQNKALLASQKSCLQALEK